MRWRADQPWQLVLGPVVWSLWFVAVYGGQALACRAGPPAPAIGAGLLAFTAIVGAGLAWAAWRGMVAARHAPAGVGRFLARTGAALHAVAALSTAFVGLPILWVPACA